MISLFFRELDPKAEVLYQNALKLLERKRWGAVEAYDLNGAYKDMEEAAQLGHLDAKKILGKCLSCFSWILEVMNGKKLGKCRNLFCY